MTGRLRSLTVRTSGLRNDFYPGGDWEETVFDDGRLIVCLADGTKVTYAPGHWLRTKTEL